MAVNMTRVPVREQEPLVRAKNFDEVCLGYSEEEAVAEAERCLHCAKPLCVQGCPVSINIPEFIQEVKNRDFKKAYDIINEDSSLPAVCGRVCPQETQCEGKCILGKKVIRYPSESWNVLWRIGPAPMVLNRQRQRSSVRNGWLSSAPVRQD